MNQPVQNGNWDLKGGFSANEMDCGFHEVQVLEKKFLS